MENPPECVFTIGHSTRTAEEFLALLRRYGIQLVADVRSVPRSKRNPQFNRDTLPAALAAAGIRYVHMPELGGFRRPRPDSPNPGWKNDSFRGFADYMQTDEFRDGLEKLLAAARREKTAILCAEAVPWRCHRSLIADALVFEGVPVEDILGLENSRPHRPTPFAVRDGARVIYPEPGPDDPAGEKGV
ncbi:MAG: DUF488 domain-containing protein [Anaerolineales bacterium]